MIDRALIGEELASPEDAWLALAQVEETLAHREHALGVRRIYDNPLSAQAGGAQAASSVCSPRQ